MTRNKEKNGNIQRDSLDKEEKEKTRANRENLTKVEKERNLFKQSKFD